jgi:hypothetical protein
MCDTIVTSGEYIPSLDVLVWLNTEELTYDAAVEACKDKSPDAHLLMIDNEYKDSIIEKMNNIYFLNCVPGK